MDDMMNQMSSYNQQNQQQQTGGGGSSNNGNNMNFLGPNSSMLSQMHMTSNFPQGIFNSNNIVSSLGNTSNGMGNFSAPRRVSAAGGMSNMSMPGIGLGIGGGGFMVNNGANTGANLSSNMRQDKRSNTGTLSNTPFDNTSMQDLFGRRSSVGIEDNIFGRRDSMESSTAVLDACILDLTRRRLSMAMGAPSQQVGVTGLPMSSNDYNLTNSNTSGIVLPTIGTAAAAVNPNFTAQNTTVSALAARQQQIQQQQLELDKRQKEIDMQRQQLLSGFQDPYNQMSASAGNLHFGGLSGPLSGTFNNSLANLNRMTSQAPSLNKFASQNSGERQPNQWWVCQICNNKAFASRQEAVDHESICTDIQGVMNDHHQQQEQMFLQQQQGQQLQQHNFLQSDHLLQNKVERFNAAANAAAGQTGLQQHNYIGMMQAGAQQDYKSEMTDIADEGPFANLPQPLPLAMSSDKDWLTPLHCFVRSHCVEVFCASTQDVATPSKGKRKPIQIGQVGIRCPHCHTGASSEAGQRERGSVYYPTTISSIYNATMNLLQRHLHSCPSVPKDIMTRYQTLKSDDARSGTSKKYWVESALSLGLVDTADGIRFSARRPPPLPRLSRHQHSTGLCREERRNSKDYFSSNVDDEGKDLELHANDSIQEYSDDIPDGGKHVIGGGGKDGGDGKPYEEKSKLESSSSLLSSSSSSSSMGPLVSHEDQPYATAFSFRLLSQMQPCVFTEADRLGKRKGLPAGFSGLACRHCFGGYGSGRFFPSSIKTLSDTSKTLNVLFNHMMRCRKCPQDVKDLLEKLRAHHDDDRAKMKFGSQKAFFAKIWSRLHDKDGTVNASYTDGGSKRKSTQQVDFSHPSSEDNNMMSMGGMSSFGYGLSMGSNFQMSTNNPMMGGLDMLSRQADSNKRQRYGL